MAQNITKVYLLSVPLESDYKNTLYFANASDQQTYFQSRIVKSYTDFSYQRKDHVIRIPEEYDTIAHVNYVMYQNTAYSNKWFYAFVKNLRYVNDGMTEATIETDVIQTWLFDYTVKSSFVEREHVNNDTIGLHTISEGLETGDYINQPGTETAYQVRDLNFTTPTYICVAVPDIPNFAMPGGNRYYNRIYSGLYYIVFKDATEVDKFIKAMATLVTEDNIGAIFMVPKAVCNLTDADFESYTVGSTSVTFAFCNFSTTSQEIAEVGFNKENYLDSDYVPRNKKLLTYPYRYLLLSNGAGSIAEYKYEYFTTETCIFTVKGAISPGCSIKIFPNDYKEGEHIKGLDCGKFPTCSWINDPYTNWLTQNAVNLKIDTIKNIGSIIAGGTIALASGGTAALAGGGLAVGGILGIGEQMKAKYEHSLAPETAKGGANQGDLNYSDGVTFKYYKMSIKKEFAQSIDSYFDMFGYQVNQVKVPNKNHRSRWWYTKCIDVSLDGSIPQDDIEIIKNCYNSGIRFWRNASEIENYSLANGIV